MFRSSAYHNELAIRRACPTISITAPADNPAPFEDSAGVVPSSAYRFEFAIWRACPPFAVITPADRPAALEHSAGMAQPPPPFFQGGKCRPLVYVGLAVLKLLAALAPVLVAPPLQSARVFGWRCRTLVIAPPSCISRHASPATGPTSRPGILAARSAANQEPERRRVPPRSPHTR